MITFQTTILQMGNNTGIEVPEDQLQKLGGGKKPLVVVAVNDFTYRSAVAKMGDRFLIGLSAANRKASGLKGGDAVQVTLSLDTEDRTVEIPEDLQAALDRNSAAKAAFEKLAPSKKKAMVASIGEAKSAETKQRRIEKAIQSLS